MVISNIVFFFFFNDTSTSEIYTLSLHDALPISKFRRKILADLPLLRALLSRWRARWAAAGIEFGGEPDRTHFLLRYPPTVNLSAVVRTLKSRSASAYLNRFGAFYWRRHSRTRWSGGFFLCSVGGATLDILKAYLEQQGC